MPVVRVEVEGRQAVLHQMGGIGCTTPEDLAGTTFFSEVVAMYVRALEQCNSPLLERLPIRPGTPVDISRLVASLRALAVSAIEQAATIVPGLDTSPAARKNLGRFVEGLYDYWRSFTRYMILHSDPISRNSEERPYRAFNTTVERLNDLVRGLYRDIAENISGDHPRVYRQIAAGCTVGIIAAARSTDFPEPYGTCLRGIPFIRQVLIVPPLIIDPPMNKRTGEFLRIDTNPLASLRLDPSKFLCYPAQVGPLTVFAYFHQSFLELGCSLANLFELATDEQIEAGADALFVFGAPPEAMKQYGDVPTVFFDDEASGLLVGVVPLELRFGYFGYLKKMMLTLHNIVMMKRGRMPFHGAMTTLLLNNGAAANVLLMGDTATGKSESLEAFRILAKDHLRDMRIVADDMGSLAIDEKGFLLGYGTEIGAFIRLDDLQQGYAFGQIDRAIIMSPQKINARAVLPVTTLDEVLSGYPVNIMLYANNYEEVDEHHPIVERFETPERALAVFREGAAMAKGTTTSKGLGHTYFANIFGPVQYKELHEKLAHRTFDAAFSAGAFVGQMRTRLGIPGYEASGPEEAAKELFKLISEMTWSRTFGG